MTRILFLVVGLFVAWLRLAWPVLKAVLTDADAVRTWRSVDILIAANESGSCVRSLVCGFCQFQFTSLFLLGAIGPIRTCWTAITEHLIFINKKLLKNKNTKNDKMMIIN